MTMVNGVRTTILDIAVINPLTACIKFLTIYFVGQQIKPADFLCSPSTHSLFVRPCSFYCSIKCHFCRISDKRALGSCDRCAMYDAGSINIIQTGRQEKKVYQRRARACDGTRQAW